MLAHLKCKIMSLAAEAVVDKQQEARWLKKARLAMRKHQSQVAKITPEGTELYIGHAIRSTRAYDAFESIRHHRHTVVRRECRHSHLAYGFLRGQEYRFMEQKCWERPDFAKVERLVLTFSDEDDRDVKQRFERWVQEARLYIRNVTDAVQWQKDRDQEILDAFQSLQTFVPEKEVAQHLSRSVKE